MEIKKRFYIKKKKRDISDKICKELVLPHPPIPSRRHPLHLPENPGKIIGVSNAALLADPLYGVICEAEQTFGVSDADLDEIADDRYAELFLENAGQVILVDEKLFGECVERDLLLIVGVNIVLDVLEILLFRVLFSGKIRIPAFFHEEREQGREFLVNLHIFDIGRRICDGVQLVQGVFKRCGIVGVKTGASAALCIFVINTV